MMQVNTRIFLNLSLKDHSSEEVQQLLFDAYMNYATIKHLAGMMELVKENTEDLAEWLRLINEKALEYKNREIDIISNAVWSHEKINEKTVLNVELNFPESYASCSKAEMQQIIFNMLVNFVCIKHAEDAVTWCEKSNMGNDNEKESARWIFEYHKNWREICARTPFEIEFMNRDVKEKNIKKFK